MSNLKTTLKSAIEQEVTKNLLSAQKRIAENGSAREVIRVSRFLLWLAKKRGDVLVDAVAESNQ